MDPDSLACWLIAWSTLETEKARRARIEELGEFARACSVRAALAAATAALPVWERAEPSEPAVRERLDAVSAWLACPCEAHADAAGDLAFANGDDNAMRGWSSIRIDGREIESPAATYAHWSADSACSAVWTPYDPGEPAGTAYSQAVEALDDPIAKRAVAYTVADALAPYAEERRRAAPPIADLTLPMTYGGPALSDAVAFAKLARRILAVLGAPIDTPCVHIERSGIATHYRFENDVAYVQLVAGDGFVATIERPGVARVIVRTGASHGERGTVDVDARDGDALRIARALTLMW